MPLYSLTLKRVYFIIFMLFLHLQVFSATNKNVINLYHIILYLYSLTERKLEDFILATYMCYGAGFLARIHEHKGQGKKF